jgi:prolipoprotein diacylglyceryltransferase
LLHSKTQKDQKYFCCFSSFVSLSFSISLLSFKIRFVIQKSKNILLYCLFLFALVSKTRKPKNICCFFLVLYSVFRVGQPSVTPMELGFHSYHSKQHK